MNRIASLAMVGTFALAMLGTAVAAPGDQPGTSYEDRNGVTWYANYGFDRGLKDGARSGHEDAEKGFRYRATDHGQFKSGTDGFNGGCSKDTYKEAYRAGYLKGYRQAYTDTMKSFGYNRVR